MTQEQQTASTAPGDRDPAAIQDDIARTRSQMDDTLTELQQRLSPEMLFDQVRGYLSADGGRDFLRNLTESVKRNPVPMAMIGVGIGWLMMSGRKGYTESHTPITNPAAASEPGEPRANLHLRKGAREADTGAEARNIAEQEGVTPEDHERRHHKPGTPTTPGL